MSLTLPSTAFQDISSSFEMRYNDTAVHSVPVGINILGSILHMNALKSQNKTPYPLESTILAFPDLKPQWTYDNTAFVSILLIGMALAIIPGSFGILVVAERQVRTKEWITKRFLCLFMGLHDKTVFGWLLPHKTEVISSANQKKDRYHKDSLDFKVNPSTPVWIIGKFSKQLES